MAHTDDDSAIETDEVLVTATEPEDVLNTMAIKMHTCDYMGQDNAYLFTLTGDDDGDPLTFIKVSDLGYGSVIINKDGTGKYWLNDSDDSTDYGSCAEGLGNSFEYKLNDSTVDPAPATVTLDLLPS